MEQKSLNIEEIEEAVDEIIGKQLTESTATPDEESSQALSSSDTPTKEGGMGSFGNSLRTFIQKKYPNSALMLKSGEKKHACEDQGYLEKVASNICGITRQQLMVIFFVRVFTLSVKQDSDLLYVHLITLRCASVESWFYHF